MPADQWTIERTEQKFEYARILLDELLSYPGRWSNDTRARAHEEAVLFHLVGAIEGTFQEMNAAFGVGLDLKHVKLPTLRAKAKTNAALAATLGIYETEREQPSGWLDLLYELRNWGMHRQHSGRHMCEGDPAMAPTSFADPRTRAPVPGSTTDVLAQFEANGRALVRRIRATYPRCR